MGLGTTGFLQKKPTKKTKTNKKTNQNLKKRNKVSFYSDTNIQLQNTHLTLHFQTQILEASASFCHYHWAAWDDVSIHGPGPRSSPQQSV